MTGYFTADTFRYAMCYPNNLQQTINHCLDAQFARHGLEVLPTDRDNGSNLVVVEAE